MVGTAFKRMAEDRAVAERKALDLTPACRLDPRHLADAKGMAVMPLSTLPGVSKAAMTQLTQTDPGAFSGSGVALGDDILIIVNDAHTAERQVNTIAHEIAHFMLDHPMSPAFGEWGRTLDKKMEAEADFLAACLLVPAAGLHVGLASDLTGAAAHYGVSVELMRWRYHTNKWRFGKGRQSSRTPIG